MQSSKKCKKFAAAVLKSNLGRKNLRKLRNFLKKIPLPPQKQGSDPAPLLFCNSVAKLIEVLRDFERFFTKNLSTDYA